MNRSHLAMLVFCLGGAQAAQAAGSAVGLQSLEVLGESRLPAPEFRALVRNHSGATTGSNENISGARLIPAASSAKIPDPFPQKNQN